jgi:hypothetical protein
MNVAPGSTDDPKAEALLQQYIEADVGDFSKFGAALVAAGHGSAKCVYVHKVLAIPGGDRPGDSPVTRLAKASPKHYGKKVFSSVAVLPESRDRGTQEWYGRLMLLFRVENRPDAGGFALLRYWSQDRVTPVCPETGFPRLRWEVTGGGYHVEDIETLRRVVHVVPTWENPNLWLVNTDLK